MFVSASPPNHLANEWSALAGNDYITYDLHQQHFIHGIEAFDSPSGGNLPSGRKQFQVPGYQVPRIRSDSY
jgi:hypothetical protein